MLRLLQLLLLFPLINYGGHITLARKPLLERVPKHSVMVASNSNGTIHDAVATNFSDQCLLWDASCSGNRTMAIERFFDIAFSDQFPDDTNTNWKILDNECFTQDYMFVNQLYCGIYNSPERLSNFEKIKSWMRSPQCVSVANEWIAMTGHPWSYVFDPDFNESRADYIANDAFYEDVNESRTGSTYDNSSDGVPSCCGVCSVSAQNVDLYYWPEPEANLSCTSIIGESIRPLDYGATTSATDTYWGCNTTYSHPIISHPGESTTYVEVITTAVITTIGSLAVKLFSYSPWSSRVCGEDDAGSRLSNQSLKVRNRRGLVYARGHSLVMPSSVVKTDGLPVSTVVSGDFTL